MTRSKLQLTSDLGSYFTAEVVSAAKKQGLKMSEHACSYLARILTKFSQTEQLLVDNNIDEIPPTKTFPTLAMLWMDSLQSNPTEQFFKLQHLGDVALFTTGFFAERLDRRNIDMDYYFAMGEKAYQRAGHLRESLAHESRINVYFELAEHFGKCSEVFAELADTALLRSEKDILRLYEKWLKTRNFRISRMLNEVGVITGVPSKKGDPAQFD